jgi:hypothetical protein
LLRPATDSTSQSTVREIILEAYAAYEAEQVIAEPA